MEYISRHELVKKFEKDCADHLKSGRWNDADLWEGYRMAFKSMGVFRE